MTSQVDFQVRVFGRPVLRSGGLAVRLSPGAVTLLAFLAIGPVEGRSRSSMALQLFGNCAEPVAKRRLSTALWRLRGELKAAVGTDLVDCRNNDVVCLNRSMPISVDALDFRALVMPILVTPARDLSDADAQALADAVSQYGGMLLESLYDDWVLEERDRFSNLYLTALDYLIQFHGARNAPDEVARYATRALDLEPLREDFHRHVMTAFGESGRLDLVERQFETCRLTLLRELGADPMPETLALYGRLCGGASGRTPESITALISDLERARHDIDRVASLVERSLDALRRLR